MSDLDDLVSRALSDDRYAFACLLERETAGAYRDDDLGIVAVRLHEALEEAARRNPLPAGFTTRVAESLEDRPRAGRGWLGYLPVLAATVIVAAVVIVLPLSLVRGPSGPASPSTRVPSAAAEPTVAVPPGLTEAEAVARAIEAVGEPGLQPESATYGPARQVLGLAHAYAEVPTPDTWVWLINLSDGGPPLGATGVFVVLDYVDGTVYGIQRWIS